MEKFMIRGKTYTVVAARQNLAEILNRAHYRKEVTTITKHGQPFACIAPIEALDVVQILGAIKNPVNQEQEEWRAALTEAIRLDPNLEPDWAEAHYSALALIRLIDMIPDQQDSVTDFLSSIEFDRSTLPPPLRPDHAEKFKSARKLDSPVSELNRA